MGSCVILRISTAGRYADSIVENLLRRGARSSGDPSVPPLKIVTPFQGGYFRPRGEIDRHQCRDVGDREARPRDEIPVGELPIQLIEQPPGRGAPAFGERRDLGHAVRHPRQRAPLERGRRIAQLLCIGGTETDQCE